MVDNDNKPSLGRGLRLLIALALLLLVAVVLMVVLQLTESALNIWHLLGQMSPTLLGLYLAGLVLFAFAALMVAWWFFKPRKPVQARRREAPPPKDAAELEARLEQAAGKGIATHEARTELRELQQRQQRETIYVVLFGPVSAGKSSLIKALTGDASIETDPRAGTTRYIAHYALPDDEQADITLTDAPGILDTDPDKVARARDEARRAHLVVYVTDGELTRDQYQEISELLAFGRPLVIALNKIDRYAPEDLEAIKRRIAERAPDVPVIAVRAGGTEEVIRVMPDGSEQRVARERPADISALRDAIRDAATRRGRRLTELRDQSLLSLGAEKLHASIAEYRRGQAEKLVKQYTRKAMLGAMAAVTPGTDLLIQGYLGVSMAKALANLYEVRVREMDLEQFVELASKNVGKRMPVLLALSGNVLKAFPGIGTVTGGILHAVAYGMIFDSLGKAVAKTLDETGALESGRALNYFEETLGGNLENRAKRFARLAVEEIANRR